MITVILIVSLFLIFFIISKLKQIIEKKRLSFLYREKYSKLIRNFNLTLSEIDLINKMAIYLKNPEKKYLLLINKHTFNYCLAYVEKNEPAESLKGIITLREKLGFDKYDPFEKPFSTLNLYKGMPVKISKKNIKNLIWNTGKIINISDKNIIVEFTDDLSLPDKGTEIKMAVHDFRGVFLFNTKVDYWDKNILYLHHTHNRVAIQQRQYYRRKMNLKVFLKNDAIKEEMKESQLIDISGNGASLLNPGKNFKKGDDIRFFFHNDENEWYGVNAEVIRLSQMGKTMHIRFGHLKDTIRDRIIGLVS